MDKLVRPSNRPTVLNSFFWALLVSASTAMGPVQAAAMARADVAVIVDTSTSMEEPGMDPERASLLVTKLLADIVPGDLAVIRLLDLEYDKAWLPSHPSGKFMPCSEDPRKSCSMVEQDSNWEADARSRQFGALVRPSRGDADYKQKLERHLVQSQNNSMFNLAFQAAAGFFGQHPEAVPRTVIWLSDGRSDSISSLQQAVSQVQSLGATVEAIVFGAGDVALPQKMGVDTLKVSNPAEIMKAFANAFRRIVQAPYRIDNTVTAEPRFEMKHNVQEAWIVVYGDRSLGAVTLAGPDGEVRADYAADVWPTAGAYKVAYLQQPKAGAWTVKAKGGGAGVAYAVIQRSDLEPVLVSPTQAFAGMDVPLVVEIHAGANGEWVTDPELLKGAVLTATVDDHEIELLDNGSSGDASANDGRFTGMANFPTAGEIPVHLHLKNEIADRGNEATISVVGQFDYTGEPIGIDLGHLGVDSEACRPLIYQANHQGRVIFELKTLQSLPSGHTLAIHLPTGVLTADAGTAPIKPNELIEVCLKTSVMAASSQAEGEPWLALQVAGSQKPEQQLVLNLRWQVQGLSFWERWGWLVWSILAALVVLSIILGFVLPHRFRGSLALVFVPERDELDEQLPQPVKQWRGVSIGFYRNARAFLQPDYRLSGKANGALAGLFAERSGCRVAPGSGVSLFRETLDGDWEPVLTVGCRGRPGDIYRVGSHGPYFRIAVKG
ncbi:choice-of-anchor X domain-containing protein [Methylovulum psychrotolerans]|uniref:VWFA domain-containing protein n=1 Tax=Methylovulum psychrotolerans TaxID=1704499 RepID=A0A1Z4C285_9GAMM|nr:choice-of-anchor X domain-containing protein [Methylovulum psychrotolerans]ASF47637.1 hypothetical protein CEK71_17065 [Methylovulum psychrotolerans]